MPALTEARRERPGSRLYWVVEEAFAPLVRLHPGVDEVNPVAWRRWRKSLFAPATLAEIAASLRGIRARRYDEIIDSQGLLRSALMARVVHGRRHGYDSGSIREPLAAAFLRRAPRRQPRAACDRAQPDARRPRARISRRRARLITASTARRWRRRRADATPCCCMRRRGRKNNGRKTTGSRSARRLAARTRSHAAVGHRRRACASATHRGATCRARASATACRSMRSRG